MTTMFLVAVCGALLSTATAETSPCVSCATRGVTAFFDGCNQCSCNNGVAACTKRACEPNADPTVCTGKCDGFVVPSDDGCGSCTCKNGLPEQCVTGSSRCADPCSAVTCAPGKRCVASPKQCFTTPCPQFECVVDDGAHKCGCNGAICKSSQGCANNGTCINLPTQNWIADGAPFCVRGGDGRCCGDQFGASCAASDLCINGQCVPSTRIQAACATPVSPCYNCKTAGIKSYFDGCNQCTCQTDGTAACTDRACDAVLPDPKSCQMQCDGARTQDDGACGRCLCIGGEKTQCSNCGVGTGCKLNAAGNFQCVAVVPPQPKACDAKPCAADQVCVEEPKQCVREPCPQYRCDAAPQPKACSDKPCAEGEVCVDEPKQCKTTPCPQFRCEAAPNSYKCFNCKTEGVKSYFDGCNQCSCQADGTAVCTKRACITLFPDPKQCAGHCDGFVTTDDGACGTCLCIGGQKTKCSKCGVGSGCKTNADGKSECVAVVPPEPKSCADKPCAADETCVDEPKQCITTPCPQYRCDAAPTNTCFNCKTAGVKSYYDGCNTCTCQADGTASCTELACIAVVPDAKQCGNQCDGFLTEDDGGCGRCTCVGGQKTKCSACGVGTGCKTVDGKSQCTAVVPPQATCVTCNSDRVCINAEVPKGDDACNTCKCIDGKKQQCTSRTCSAACKGVTKCAEIGLVCVAEPKNCITAPCDQFACVEIGSDAARKDANLAAVDQTDSAAQMSAMAATVMVIVATMF